MDPKIRYGKLENGLSYYIRANTEPQQRAEFYIAQNVGAILENDLQNGLAHFLEHMAFNGTKHFPKKGIVEYEECALIRTSPLGFYAAGQASGRSHCQGN